MTLLNSGLCSWLLCFATVIWSNSSLANTSNTVSEVAALKLDQIQFKRLLQNAHINDQIINMVTAIKQDKNGFIWLGGENGLARYDGHKFKLYLSDAENPQTLASNAVRDIIFDHDNVMWIATNGGLSRYDSTKDVFDNFKADIDKNNNNIGKLNGDAISNSSIRALAVDANNNLLIGTDGGLDILDPSRSRFTYFNSISDNENYIPSHKIHAIFVDDDFLWLGTEDAGLIKLKRDPISYEQFTVKQNAKNNISDNRITNITRDYLGYLWIATLGGGLNKLDTSNGVFTHYKHDPKINTSIGSNTIWYTLEDNQKQLWIGTDHGGLALYDRVNDNFRNITHNPNNILSISSNTVRSIFEDNKGDIWTGNFPIGANYFNRSTYAFENYKSSENDPNTLSNSSIITLQKGQHGKILIGTEKGLNIFDASKRTFKRIMAKPGIEGELQFDTILSLLEQDNGELWVGTWSAGLHHYDTTTNKFTQLLPIVNDENSLNNSFIWSLLLENNETLWVGTETGGLNRFNLKTKKITHFIYNPELGPKNVSGAQILSLLKDKQGIIWVGTNSGLNSYDENTETFKHYINDDKTNNAVNLNRIICLAEDKNENLWIGSQGGGISIFNKQRSSIKTLTIKNDLPSNNIASIVEDLNGTIWVTTDNGIASINPNNFSIKKFKMSQGLISNNFNRNASLIDENGFIYVGSSEGISIFNPNSLNESTEFNKPTFTALRIFDADISLSTPKSPLKKSIFNTEKIKLNYDQNTFSIDFSALSYRASDIILYKYMLTGFDNNWSKPSNKATASYANLKAGNYTLKVTAMTPAGQWSTKTAVMSITVTPTPYATWWAKTLYFSVFMLILFLIFRHQTKKMELIKEKAVNAKLIHLDKMKDSFLANTSHELKTPLNGIIGLAESLIDNNKNSFTVETSETLKMIIVSGKRLAHLVNDILDISKNANNTITLNKQDIDLWESTNNVVKILTPLAGNKPITIVNKIPNEFNAVIADANRLQQILLNLIANAIKYSDKGKISISAQQDEKSTTIKIKDNGLGIAKEHLDSIFNSFIQLEHSDARETGGTGLGLTITKKLIELHGGSISVFSEIGRGSSFIFTLSTGKKICTHNATEIAHIKNTVIKPQENTASSSHLKEYDSVKNPSIYRHSINEKSKAASDNNITILSVDDDAINRMVLAGLLKKNNYKILEAANGFEALEIINAHPEINLVILDVMMPKMTGYEVCTEIRKKYPIYQLPIIFLTAKDINNEFAEGFSCGGNDFSSKPIEKNELLARIKVQLSLSLRKQY